MARLGNLIIKATKRYFKNQARKQNNTKSTYLPAWVDSSKDAGGLNKYRMDYLNYLRNMPYTDYLNTAHWRNTRQRALVYYKYTCQKCGAKDNLHVHHKSYANKGFEQVAIDLTVLCQTCHKKVHKKH